MRRLVNLLRPSALALMAAGQVAAAEDRLAPHMRVLGITVEGTTLQEVQRSFGTTDMRHNGGDAAAAAVAECYVGSDGTTLVLLSGEMGGGTIITHFQLLAREALASYSDDDSYAVPADKRPGCAALNALSRTTATGGRLKLGMSAAEVKRLLRIPSQKGDGYWEYLWEGKVRMTPQQMESWHARRGEDFFVRGRTLRVEFSAGKVVAIRAWQVTTW